LNYQFDFANLVLCGIIFLIDIGGIMKNNIAKIKLKISNMMGSQKYSIDFVNMKLSLKAWGIRLAKSFANKKIEKQNYNKFLKEIKKVNFEEWAEDYGLCGNWIMTDGEDWNVELTFLDGSKAKFEGYMSYPRDWEIFLGAINCLSIMFAPNVIKKIEIEYQRKSKYFDNNLKLIKSGYKSKILFDGEKGVVLAKQTNDIGNSITKRLNLGYQVAENLSHIEIMKKPKNIKNLKINPNNIVKYRVKAEKYDGSIQSIAGYYIPNDLPENWEGVLADLTELINKFDYNEIFDEELFEKRIKKDTYKIASIQFEDAKCFYYKTSDEKIVVGDYVTVPFGRENNHKNGYVVDIKYLKKDKLPLKLEKIKDIICKL